MKPELIKENIMVDKKKFHSVFHDVIESKEFKDTYEKEQKEFALSELIISLMENDDISIRKLAKKINVAPATIQRLRSGDRTDAKLSNFLSIVEACGGSVFVKVGEEQIHLHMDT